MNNIEQAIKKHGFTSCESIKNHIGFNMFFGTGIEHCHLLYSLEDNLLCVKYNLENSQSRYLLYRVKIQTPEEMDFILSRCHVLNILRERSTIEDLPMPDS